MCSDGNNPLMLAASAGQDRAVELLLSQPCVREQLEAADEEGGMTALMIACLEGHAACVRLLLDADYAATQVQATNV